jgi:hypothetical protein
MTNKQFKLIKEYPGSPKLGTLISSKTIKVENNEDEQGWNYSRIYPFQGATFTQNEIENSPEFWILQPMFEVQSIIHPKGITVRWNEPNDYPYQLITTKEGRRADTNEVFKDNLDWVSYFLEISGEGWVIQSVKRMSDGEIFNLGDIYSIKNVSAHGVALFNKHHVIKFINVTEDELIFSNKDDFAIIIQKDFAFDKIIKSKPVFKTFDGVDLYIGSEFYALHKRDYNFRQQHINSKTDVWVVKITGTEYWLNSTTDYDFFSSLEKAKEHQKQMKKRVLLFTTEDGVDKFEGDNFIGIKDFKIIHNTFSAQYHKCLLNTFNDYKAFHDEGKAQEYIFNNKPLLSLKDVITFYDALPEKDFIPQLEEHVRDILQFKTPIPDGFKLADGK